MPKTRLCPADYCLNLEPMTPFVHRFLLLGTLSLMLYVPRLWGQTAQSRHFRSAPVQKITEHLVPEGYVETQLQAIEAPRPDGESVRAHLMRLRAEQRKRIPPREGFSAPNKTAMDSLSVSNGKYLFRTLPNGIEIPLFGGVPNDNSLAVSDGGLLLLAFNSHIAGYDLNTGEDLFDLGKYPIGLIGQEFNGPSNHFYDPKVAYDPLRDRFVLAFLRGNTPSGSGVMLAFSQSNDPRDGWNVYVLPGNPLNNDRWTDFPTIAITESELIFTANFIIPGQPWQTGFDGSMIWQVGIDAGYAGDSTLDARLWYDIKHNGRFTRNVHAVQHGGHPDRKDLFLLSNRNFSLQNDTLFLLHLTGERNDPDTRLDVQALISDTPYGVPPFGRQSDTDTSDAGSGFDTNDGRVLGGFFVNDHLQFVSNTIDPQSGRSAIYHGLIEDPYGSPSVRGQIIGHERLDFGYPNVAWTGTEPCERQSMIGFNHSSPMDAAGCSALFYSDLGTYSPITYLTQGEAHVDRMSGGYERWGDYFGLQRVYNRPGEVWASGYYGHSSEDNGIYSARIYSPDTLHLDWHITNTGGNANCEASVEVEAINGTDPITYSFNGGPASNSNRSTGHCPGDTILVEMTDGSLCTRSEKVIIPLKDPGLTSRAYPVPADDLLISRLLLPASGTVDVQLSDLNGRELVLISERYASTGAHELQMNVAHLSAGTYFLKVFLNGKELSTDKVLIN